MMPRYHFGVDDAHAMTVRFPERTYERLRAAAFERRVPMNTIITEEVERGLDEIEAGARGDRHGS